MDVPDFLAKCTWVRCRKKADVVLIKFCDDGGRGWKKLTHAFPPGVCVWEGGGRGQRVTLPRVGVPI
jgi:hypothetical protein